MHNLVYLIGRLMDDPKVETSENGKTHSNITLAVQRSFKNASGEYEVDFIECATFSGNATNLAEYCHKGDLIGIKGSLQMNTYEKDGKSVTKLNVVADKISFLSSKNIGKENKEVEGR